MSLSSKLSFKEYQTTIENLTRLSKAGRFTASRYLSQIRETAVLYFISPERDNPNKNNAFTDFSPLVILVRQAQRHLSAYSKQELKNPSPAITFSQPQKYPGINDEDLQIT